MGGGDAGLAGEAIGVRLLDREHDLLSLDLVPPLVEREHHRLLEPVVGPPETLDPPHGLGVLPIPPEAEREPSRGSREDREKQHHELGAIGHGRSPGRVVVCTGHRWDRSAGGASEAGSPRKPQFRRWGPQETQTNFASSISVSPSKR